MLVDTEPLQVVESIGAAGAQRRSVIDLIAWAGAARGAVDGAWVGVLERGACGARALALSAGVGQLDEQG